MEIIHGSFKYDGEALVDEGRVITAFPATDRLNVRLLSRQQFPPSAGRSPPITVHYNLTVSPHFLIHLKEYEFFSFFFFFFTNEIANCSNHNKYRSNHYYFFQNILLKF